MNKILKEILSTSVYILVILLSTYLIINYVGQRTRVIGSSMETTLSDGDNLIVDKISYRFRDPARYDIIVFPYLHKEKTYYIKRIIGLPGETVRIDTEGNIYINDELLEESYGREVMRDPGIAIDTMVLDEDEYFVLGDNRNDSSDSRVQDVGKIKRENIIGKAFFRLYPFDKIEVLKHQ